MRDQMMFVKPARPDVKVRHPETRQHIPAGGTFVRPDAYWDRRIADGDVVVVEAGELVPEEQGDEPVSPQLAADFPKLAPPDHATTEE